MADFDYFKQYVSEQNRIRAKIQEEENPIHREHLVAINQMIDGEDMLRWLGRYDLPDNLKIIISVKKDSAMIAVEPGKFYAFEIKGLDEPGKRRLINQYLGNYLKTLDDEQIDVICSFEASENPLFLKVLLSELRVFGSFDQLSEEIGRFGNSPVSAFKHVLDRLESDGRKTNIVPLMFSLLASVKNAVTNSCCNSGSPPLTVIPPLFFQ